MQAIVLAKHLVNSNLGNEMTGKTIELGSGCGFTSIYLAHHFPRMEFIASEQESIIELL